MGALRKAKASEYLYDEITLTPSVLGKRVEFIYSFLTSRGIYSLKEISVSTLKAFIISVSHEYAFSKTKYSSFKGDLETVYFAYMKCIGASLSQIHPYADNPCGRKCLTFLMVSGIKRLSDITAETRVAYDEYLQVSVPKKRLEYLKVLDRMVLSEIEKIGINKAPGYKNTLLFLGYYPDPYITKRLYNTARKEFFYFDFSLPVNLTLKKQIHKILISDLSRIGDIRNHYLIQQFITPLYYLYGYCVSAGIEDIKQITDAEASEFFEYLSGNMDAEYMNAPQVLHRARRFLFLNDEKADFNANCWFLERFSLTDRSNPTRGIECFNFGDVSAEHRVYFKHFMKYLIIISPKYSAQSMREKYYGVKEFLRYLEERGATLTELSYADIEGYIDHKNRQELKPETYNRTLTILSFFLTVMNVREKLLIPSFPFDYYYKKAGYLHHDRSVKDDTIKRILTVLPDFPETTGLIYLTLYSTGLRINEVCALKKDALTFDNGACWISLYQYKLHSDKQIPVPPEISRLLIRHLDKDKTGSEYLFPSCKDPLKPYQAATFVKQFKKQLLLYDATKDITFKSHDYRHTIATDLHMSGVPLSTTRAFLGHRDEDMTKQYIDHLPGHIDMLQDKYFKENRLT